MSNETFVSSKDSQDKILKYEKKRNLYLTEFNKVKNITNDNEFFIQGEIDILESIKQTIRNQETTLSDLEADLYPTSQEQKNRLRKQIINEINEKKIKQHKLQNDIDNYIKKNEKILKIKDQYYTKIIMLNKMLDDSSSLRKQSSNIICPICQENIYLDDNSIKCPNESCQVYYHKYCIRDYCRNADNSYSEQYEILDDNGEPQIIEEIKKYPKLCPICNHDWNDLCDDITTFKKSPYSAFDEFTKDKKVFNYINRTTTRNHEKNEHDKRFQPINEKIGGKKKSKKIKRKKSSKRRFKR